MATVPPRFQIKTTAEILDRAKVLAFSSHMNLTEYMLHLLAEKDDEIKKLIEKDLASRTRPGNPAKPKS